MKIKLSRSTVLLVAALGVVFVLALVMFALNILLAGIALLLFAALVFVGVIGQKLTQIRSETRTMLRNAAISRKELKELLEANFSQSRPEVKPAVSSDSSRNPRPKAVSNDSRAPRDQGAEYFLRNRGRAATPSVDVETFPLTLAEVTSPGRERKPHDGNKVIAAFISAELAGSLEPRFDVVRLRPSCSVDQLERSQPDVLLIDRNAFIAGQWFGAESPVGESLLREIQDCVSWAGNQGLPVYYADSTVQPPDVNSAAIRSMAGMVFPRKTDAAASEGAPQSELFGQLETITLARGMN
jgi:hypothetical protein